MSKIDIKKMEKKIPKTRIVSGRDFLEFKIRIGAITDDMCAGFGITKKNWHKMVTENIDENVTDLTIISLLRAYDRDLSRWPFPIFTDWTTLVNALETVLYRTVDIELPNVACLLGRRRNNGYRWQANPAACSKAIRQLIPILQDTLDENGIIGLEAHIKEMLADATNIDSYDLIAELKKFKRDFIDDV